MSRVVLILGMLSLRYLENIQVDLCMKMVGNEFFIIYLVFSTKKVSSPQI